MAFQLASYEYKAYQKKSSGGGKRHSGPHGKQARSGAEFHRAKGEQYKLARMRPIWILMANQSNMDSRAPFFREKE